MNGELKVLSEPNNINEQQGRQDVEKLATGVSVSFIGKISGRLVFAITQILLARFLGPELFGLYALGWTVFRLLGIFTPLGLDKGIIRFGSPYFRRDDARMKDILVKSFVPGFLAATLAGVIIFGVAPYLETLFNSPGLTAILRAFAIAFPLFAGMKVLVGATQLSKRMKFTALTEDLGQPAVQLVLLVVFWMWGWGLWGTVVATVISYGAVFILAAFFVVKLFPCIWSMHRVTAVSLRKILSFSIPSAFAGVFTFLTSWSDRLILGYYQTTSAVGIYQALAETSLLFSIILRSFNTIFTPMIADLHHRNEHERLNELNKISTKWGVYLSLPLFLTVCFASQELMSVLFGSAYATGAPAFVILSVGQMINVSTGSVGFILIMTGRERFWLAISVVAFVINIVLNALWIPTYGLVGSALATAISISTLYLSGLAVARWTTGLWPYDKRYWKGLIAAGGAACALLLLKFLNLENDLLYLIVTAVTAVTVFAALLWWLGLDREDREFLDLFIRRLRIKRHEPV